MGTRIGLLKIPVLRLVLCLVLYTCFAFYCISAVLRDRCWFCCSVLTAAVTLLLLLLVCGLVCKTLLYCGVQGDMVYSLLSILGTHNRDDMSRTLLAMSTSSDSCLAMRQSGSTRFIDSLVMCLIQHQRLCSSYMYRLQRLMYCSYWHRYQNENVGNYVQMIIVIG